jgi:hypothetical protein
VQDEPAQTRRRRWTQRALDVLLICATLLIGLLLHDLVVLMLLRHPTWTARMPAAVQRHVRDVYIVRDRRVLQLSEHARFDEELLYTLLPGTFEQHEREFSVAYHVNQLGVRDDEESLRAPEIVVLGDSYAMGWGVAQDENFPALLEQRSGRRTLNAAISSYGTVREMKLFDRVDRSRTRVLIIQYCANDLPENRTFLDGKWQNSKAPSEFNLGVSRERADRRYWPGRWAFRLAARLRQPKAQEPSPTVEAQAFVHALTHAGKAALDGIDVYVLAWESAGFVAALEAERARPDAPPVVRNLHIVSLVGAFRPEDYYLLDDHWTPSGHRRAADALINALH